MQTDLSPVEAMVEKRIMQPHGIVGDVSSMKQEILLCALANWSVLEPHFVSQIAYAQAEGLHPAEYWRATCSK